MKPHLNIYLDVDGVLLTKEGLPAESVADFLEFVTKNHNVYWLTTHCRHGDASALLEYLQRKLPEAAYRFIQGIRPATWDVMKTDAIDFTKDFLWFDDYLMESEKAVLEKHNCLDKHILIDLKKNPHQLTDFYKLS
jgi:hypothetical protein